MIAIHPDDPDWATALLCTQRTGSNARPRLRARRRPIAILVDSIVILRYRWRAGGRFSKRYRKINVLEVRHHGELGAVDDGTLLVRELACPQRYTLRGYLRR